MYLKSIEVLGFKSFAQKIHFDFHNGITAIVGPNGSGKSNVADAVRWVLGEQSARQLRGGNMQDIIFAGTQARKPLSYASVAITLDNSDRKLPVNFEEVTVTRRLYRSGESEYFLNGSSCRLKDINELFYDTGIGKEGYSIIGQGQIEKILNGRPEERRELFDEAAGIVKFKRRKAAALKKLQDEETNLVRVTDILSELTRQLEPLRKQAENARIYLARREQQKELDVNLFLLENVQNEKLLEEGKENYRRASAELEQVRERFAQAKQDFDRTETQLTGLTEELEQLLTRSREDALLCQQLTGSIELIRQQISSCRQNMGFFQERLDVICEERQRRLGEIDRYEEEDALVHFQMKEAQRRERETAILLTRIQEEAAACQESMEEGKKEIFDLLNNRATTVGNYEKFQTMKEQNAARKASLNQRRITLREEETAREKKLKMAQASEEECRSRIEALEQESRRLEQEAGALQNRIREQNERGEVLQENYHRDSSRLESLRNLTERYDGFGGSIRRVMEQRSKNRGIHGVVADLIQVEKDYEIAIETALGGSIQNIVTDNEQTAKQMIEYLKRNKYGRATFLPLTAMKGSTFTNREALKEPGVLGVASDLVQTQPEYRSLVSYLLGRILVVDHMDHAIRIAGKYKYSIRMVTVEGELLSPGGSMTGGAFRNSSNLLGRRREMEELEESVRRIGNELEQLRGGIAENRNTRRSCLDTMEKLRGELQEAYLQQNTVNMTLRQLEKAGEEIQEGYRELNLEQQDIAQQQRELETHDLALARELDLSQKDEEEINAFLDRKQSELEGYRREEGEYLKSLEEIRTEITTLSQRMDFQKENLERIHRELEGFAAEEQEIREKQRALNEDCSSKEAEILELEERIRKAEQEEKASEARRAQCQAEREQLQKTHRDALERREELSEQQNRLDKEVFRLGSQVEKLEETRETQIAYLWEEYEITPANARTYRQEQYQDRAELRKLLTGVREQIRALGHVNVHAIEEYREVEERHSFLSGQYEDLTRAKATLEDIITELEDGMRVQFSEKFEEIRKEFDRAFRELFGGGKGTLELSLEEGQSDPLEAGIRIIAQPPGKKLQNMMQLSGGEKALTAIALLFAIQNMKPSPFCLLDEIEAALDDSNVVRFADYLQKLTKNTQFIIITHRRGTMNASDRLYGITMQEKGVSTLVSVDLVDRDLL